MQLLMNRRWMLMLAWTLLLVLGLNQAEAFQDDDDAPKPADAKRAANRRALIISIDGLRPDLALLADMPHLRSLMKGGAYSMWAQTIPAGITLPSHTSMLTGVPLEHHGVFWNDDTPIRKRRYEFPHVPTLFEFAKEKEYSTALVAGKYKFVALARPGSVDHLVLPEQPKRLGADGKPVPAQTKDDYGLTAYDRLYDNDWIAEKSASLIREHQPQVMMVHFPRVDTVGHAKGWGSSYQMTTIENTDRALGKILDTLRDTKLFDDTLIIISADHGGLGKVHHGKDPRGLHIPWIAHGPGIRKNYDLNQHASLVINTMDTFAMVAKFLDLTIETDVDIEGKVIKEAYEPPPKTNK